MWWPWRKNKSEFKTDAERAHASFSGRFNRVSAANASALLRASNDNNNSNLAVLVVDVQRQYCDPTHRQLRGNDETATVSQRIATTVPLFRALGVPVYAIYFDKMMTLDPADAGWYRFRPEAGDIAVPKQQDSAFRGSNIKHLLLENRHRTLLTCGFNRSSCVKSTIFDARKGGFDVVLMADLIGNDNRNPKGVFHARKDLGRFVKAGVNVVDSKMVLQNIQSQNCFSVLDFKD